MAISSEDQTKLLKGVIGLFDAAAGTEINAQLENAVDNGLSIPELLNILTTKTEFTDGVMGSATTSAEQAAVLAGNFGLTADDVEGSPATQAIDFFESGIDGGTEIGTLVYQAVVFLMRDDLPAEFAETAQLLENKAAVAAAYNAEASGPSLGGTLFDDPLINGSGPISQDDIDQVLANAGVGIPDSFTLTNQTDIATANHFVSGLVFTPGGNDRINALQDEDILTGAGPNPSMTATLGNANDNGATVITPTLIGIETLNASFTGSGGGAVFALDMQDSSGLMSVNVDRVSQAVNYAEIGNIEDATVNNLSVSDTNANDAGGVEFSYSAGTLAGENTVSLGIDNVQVGFLNIGQNTSGIQGAFGVQAPGVGTQGYENIALNSTGAPNSIGTFNIPMDTGTTGVLTITGDTDLTLGASINAVNVNNNTLVEVENLFVAGTGIAQAGSRIATIDASGLDGNFTVVLDNILDVGKAGTSGVDQDVTVTGGNGDDTFVLYDVVQAGDTIDGGAGGNDTLLFYSGSALNSLAANIDNASMFGDGSIGNLAADFDNLPDVTAVSLRNISTELAPNGTFTDAGSDPDAVLENLANAPVSFTLTNLTDTQATGITVHHATTANNQIQNTIVNAAVASDTSDDTLGITLNDGTNVDPRFNFSIVTALPSNPSTIENVTLGDDDTESNSVELTSFAAHTGTITITGGEAGDFFNLDVDTLGADVTPDGDPLTAGIQGVINGGTNVANPTLDSTAVGNGPVQQGLRGLDTDGTAVDVTAGHYYDLSGLATQVRLGAATIDASGSAADVILRVSTNAASPVGAQDISTGTGDDTVIFDNLNDTRAGLTISDTVNAGDGDDTLVIDGTGVRISLGASEWTNVSNFENLQIVGTSAAALSTLLGQNAYNLALTNDLIQANGGGMLNIINDNDANNDQSGVSTGTYWLNTAGTGAESGVTIDARSLNAQNHFTYNGEEGAIIDPTLPMGTGIGQLLNPANISGTTADRFMFTDANINGGNTIDGGAVDNLSDTNSVANADIMEVRNTATVTAGDMQGLSNIGTIAGVNDQAVAQSLDLELTDSVIDALVDSYHTATATEVETVNVRLNNAGDIATPVAAMGLILDASTLTSKTAANVTLDPGAVAFALAQDSIQLSPSGGVVTVANFQTAADAAGVDVFVPGPSPSDTLVLSLSKFNLDASVAGGNIAAGDFVSLAGPVSASTDPSAQEIVFDQSNGNVFYNTDGATAGGLIQIATLTGVGDLALADISIIA